MSLSRSALRRPWVVLALAAAAPLAGCEKPTPSVSVVSGSTFKSLPAACWNEENEPLPKGTNCAPGKAATIKVTPGSTIGISVDPDIAESGWIVDIDGQPVIRQALSRQKLTDSYHRFVLRQQDFDAIAQQAAVAGKAVLRVSAVTGTGEKLQARGVWLFTLDLQR